MAWTAPMTAVDGAQYTANMYNTQVRDNLLTMLPAKATSLGQYFVSDAAGSMAARSPKTSLVSTEDTASGLGNGFFDLATVGPQVTINLNKRALVVFRCDGMVDGGDISNQVAVFITGATSTNDWNLITDGRDANTWITMTGWRYFNDLGVGSHTFKLKYFASSSNFNYSYRNRYLAVIPF